MARNVDETISEEEDREVREADDYYERANPKEYDDEDGENTAATTGGKGGGSLEFVCTKCGKRTTAKHNASPMHHGKEMTPVDREPARTGVIGRLLSAIRRVARKLTGRKTAGTQKHATPTTRLRAAKAKRKAASTKHARPKARKAKRSRPQR